LATLSAEGMGEPSENSPATANCGRNKASASQERENLTVVSMEGGPA
jgi:hypothetical protein